MSFSNLLPDLIFDSVTEQGFIPTGSLFPLNSYENRVYLIDLEDHDPMVAKYYRPHRWSAESIGEEHRFVRALADAEIPVISPLLLKKPISTEPSLGKAEEYLYALYPRFRGRENADLTHENRRWLGRLLARVHNIGGVFKVKHRITLTPETYGYANLDFILKQPFLPGDLLANLEFSLKQALQLIVPLFYPHFKKSVVHGDCHLGNILWNREGPHLLDFDDMLIAPPLQDLWMLFHGSDPEKEEQKEAFFEGYEMFREFDQSSFLLMEPLRTLRMIHYAAWIGKRYEEAAFQRAFPYYRESRYWQEFLLSIKEQISLLQELQ